DVLEAEPNSRFRFRWRHPLDGDIKTEVTVSIRPTGYGSTVTLQDGPYDIGEEASLDEYARAIEIWAAALTQLRASVDYSVDLRKER
ncbi:MAG: SRPBCC domain-containing protein, partial [Chloroflexota bacterium]